MTTNEIMSEEAYSRYIDSIPFVSNARQETLKAYYGALRTKLEQAEALAQSRGEAIEKAIGIIDEEYMSYISGTEGPTCYATYDEGRLLPLEDAVAILHNADDTPSEEASR